MDGDNEMNLDSLERAYEALKGERWEDAAREAGAALRTADSAHAESEAALARFILGTALAGTSSGARQPAARKEARLHLEAALPHFRAAQAVDLAGDTLALLGGLAIAEARDGTDAAGMARAADCYREAAELFAQGDDLGSQCAALHNLGLCLTARTEDPAVSQDERISLLEQALVCFHDALEMEIECGFVAMTEATERERELAQRFLDATGA